jgi:hypothetical protein
MNLLTFIIFLLFLIIVYQIYQSVFVNSLKEGLDSKPEYKNYDSKCLTPNESAFMLAQQNAGNIEYLKQQISKITDLDKEVRDMSGNLVTLNEQMIALVNQQSQAASQLAGDKPISTTGLSSDESGPGPSENAKNSASKSEPVTSDDKTSTPNTLGLSSSIPSMGSTNAPKSATTFSLSSNANSNSLASNVPATSSFKAPSLSF